MDPRRRRARLALAVVVIGLLGWLPAACNGSGGAVRIEPVGRGGPLSANAVRLAAPAGLHDRIERVLERLDGQTIGPVRVIDEGAPAELRLTVAPPDGDAPIVRWWSVVTAAARIDVHEVSATTLDQALRDRRLYTAREHASLVNALFAGRGEAQAIAAELLPTRLAASVGPGASGPTALAIVPADAVSVRVRALTLDGADPVRARGDLRSYPLVTRGRIEAARPRPNLRALAAALGDGLARDEPPIHVAFTGDVIPTRCVYDAIRRDGDWTTPFRHVGDRLRSAHITVGSLDAAISARGTPIGCRETFSLLAPPEVVAGLHSAGFDVISVATNHVKDCGAASGCGDAPFLDTLAHLRAAGIQPAGGGPDLAGARRPAVVEVGGLRFAFLAYDDIAAYYHATERAPGTAPLDLATIADDVRAAHALADVVVVLPHWGEEYTPHPTPRQREVARRAIEAGAALVVGNHPHVVQAAGPLADGYVAYALGNFVFDQDWSQETTEGVVFEATFHGRRLAAVQFLPVRIRDRLQPVFLTADEATAVLKRIMTAATRLED